MEAKGLKQSAQLVLGIIIFVAFVIVVERMIGWRTLLTPWTQLSVAALIPALGLVLVSYWLRAWRQYDYFLADMRGRFGLNFKLMLQHNLLNNLLPMRTGELSFPLLMTRYFNVPASRSLPGLLWFRLLDLQALVLLALLALGAHSWGLLPVPVLALLWAVLPVAVYRWLRHYETKLSASAQLPSRMSSFLRKLFAGLPQSPAQFWRSYAWTLINWLVKVGVFAWVLILFITVPWSAAVMAVIAGDLTTVLPIHGVAGVGTYEAGVVGALLPFRVEAQAALAAAVNLHLFLLAASLISGALSLLLRGKTHHG